MNCFLSTTQKAALLSAAFLLVLGEVSGAQTTNRGISTTFEATKKQATELLLQKKKSQAIQAVRSYEQRLSNTAAKTEAREFLIRISQKFLSRTTQEAYENSLNLTVESPKEAMKSNEQCLSVEPQNLDCLIQKMRLQTREKNPKLARATLTDLKTLAQGTSYDGWLTLMADRRLPDFSARQILKALPEAPQEENFPWVILELERSFSAKNYSRAKDVLVYLEKSFADWPDLAYYQYKIDFESVESGQATAKQQSEQQNIHYSNKCKNLSKTIARKYRYDFDLCLRGND